MRRTKDYTQFKEKYCVVCGHDGSFYPLDCDHVKTLGSGSKNEPFNIMTLCRKHHQEKGQKGINYMAKNYVNYMNWLLKNKWEFEFGKWTNEGNNEWTTRSIFLS
jgi:5-methylcytosine-specific restriction endonuclease McrA